MSKTVKIIPSFFHPVNAIKKPRHVISRTPIDVRSLVLRLGIFSFVVLLALGWQTQHLPTLGFLLMLITSCWMLQRRMTTSSPNHPQLPWPIWIIGATLLFSFLFSTDAYTSLWSLLQWGGLGALLWLTLSDASFNSESLWMKALMIFAWVLGILGLIDFFQLTDPSFGVAATFGTQNTFGGVLLLLVPVFLFSSIFSKAPSSKKQWISEALADVLLVNLALTFSQGAWFIAGLTIGLGCFLLRSRWTRLAFVRMIRILGATGAIVVLLWTLHPMVNRLALASIANFRSGVSDDAMNGTTSIENRRDIFDSTWSMIQQFPWVGVGGGNFATIYPQFQRNIWTFATDPQNFALRLFAEGGIFVLLSFVLLFFWLLAFVIATLRRSAQQHQSDQPILLIGLVVSMLASLLHAMIDRDYSVFPILAILIIEMGLALALGHRLGVRLRSPHLPRVVSAGFESRITSFLFFVLLIGLTFSLSLSEYYTAQAKMSFEEMKDRVAIQYARKAITFSPWNGQAYVVLSDATLSTLFGQAPSDAKERIRADSLLFAQTAADLQPLHSAPHFQLAKIAQVSFAAEDPKFQTAIDEGAKALAFDSWNVPQYYLTQAVNLHRQGKNDQALALLQQLLDRYNPEAKAKILTADRSTIEVQLNFAKTLMERYQSE